jgi:hypothetical protein
MNHPNERSIEDALPEAVPGDRAAVGGVGRWWIFGALMGACVSLVLLLQGAGPTVTLVASHGHGIGPGDPIRFQGLEVGEVVDVRLAEGSGVELDLRFLPEAQDLARAGTRLWIVRPLLSLDAVTGLDTLLGSRYISLDPGPIGAERRTRFTALPAPPVDALDGGLPGLDFVLESPQRNGIQPGAAVNFRGVSIGAVTAVQLSSDATSVEIHVTVRSGFARLIREGSLFWELGGVEVDLTLTRGVELGLDSLRSALVGAIAVATPPGAGEPVPGGARFKLHEDAEPEWLEWTTPLPIGDDLLPGDARVGESFGAVLRWKEGRILRSTEVREGWCCATQAGLVGPQDLMTVPDGAVAESAILEVAGQRFGLAELASQGLVEHLAPGLCRISPAAFGDQWGLLAARAIGAARSLREPEDVLVFGAPGLSPLPIAASRVTFGEDGEPVVSGGPSIPQGWHGGQVLSRVDGSLVGLFLTMGVEGAPRIAPMAQAGGPR